MTIAKDIVRDLLPAYWSGEATAATRDAVEACFTQDPAFAEEARRGSQALESLALLHRGAPGPAAELMTLRRAKKVLRTQRILLAVASTFTLNAVSIGFSFEVGDGRVHAHWLALPGQGVAVGAVLLVAAVSWTLYALFSRRVHTRVLG